MEFFQNEQQASENEIQSSVRFVPYLVDHNSVKRFFEDREEDDQPIEFSLTEVVKNGKYWKDDATKLKKDLYLGCRKSKTQPYSLESSKEEENSIQNFLFFDMDIKRIQLYGSDFRVVYFSERTLNVVQIGYENIKRDLHQQTSQKEEIITAVDK